MLAEGVATRRGRRSRAPPPRPRPRPSCGRGAARGSPPSPAAAPFPTTPTTTSSRSRPGASSARSTRTSRSRACAATSSCSAITRGASAASRAGRVRVEDAAGRAADDPVLARRGAGAHARAVGGRVRAARARSRRASSTIAPRSIALAAAPSAASSPGGAEQLVAYVARDARRARHGADLRHGRRRALLRRERRHAAGRARAVRRRHQSRLGARAAQALLRDASTSSCRRPPPTTASCSRSASSTASRSPTSSQMVPPEPLEHDLVAGGAAVADVRHPLALERDPRPGAAAPQRRQARADAHPAHARRRSAGRGVPGAGRRAATTTRARSSRPSIRSSTRPSPTASTRRWTPTASARARAHRARRDPHRRRRDAGAVADGARDPERQSLRLPRRRAARRAPRARRGAAPHRSRAGGRHGRARRRGDRGGARAGLARRARRRRAARRAALAGAAAGAGRGTLASLGPTSCSPTAASSPQATTTRADAPRRRPSAIAPRGASPSTARDATSPYRLSFCAARHDRRARRRTSAGAEIVRGWLECIGPTTAGALAARLGLAHRARRRRARAARGRRHRHAGPLHRRSRATIEWCERRLLARIHHLTLGRLRREIEPVSPADFMRFLFRWQHVLPGTRLHGRDGLAASSGSSHGIELPAPAWERNVLPARVAELRPAGCSTSSASPASSRGGASRPTPTDVEAHDRRATDALPRVRPRRLPTRSGAARVASCAPNRALPARGAAPTARLCARDALARRPRRRRLPRAQGASFIADIARATGLLPTATEDALWELVARGLVTGDGFAGLRTLLLPEPEERRAHPSASARAPRRRARAARCRSAAGLLARGNASRSIRRDAPRPRRAASSLPLRRRAARALARETRCSPWRVILARAAPPGGARRGARRALRRRLRRRAVRAAGGGRGAARAVGGTASRAKSCVVAAADPLNLVGILTPGARLSPFSRKVIAYRDGVPIEVGELGRVRSRLRAEGA